MVLLILRFVAIFYSLKKKKGKGNKERGRGWEEGG